MCQIPSNPLHTIVEVSEMFQEFLKHASIDGFVESWCLEITLQSSANEIPSDLPIDCMHHLIGLHSLSYLILKRLGELHHELTSDCCSCGWEVGHVPEFQHSDIQRYTPGTIIRWSQGACHVLLAPAQEYNSTKGAVGEPTSDHEEVQKEELTERTKDNAIPPEGIQEEEEIQHRSGVIQSTEQSLVAGGNAKETDPTSPNRVDNVMEDPPEREEEEEEEPPEDANGSQYFIKHQHFCEEDVDCQAHHPHRPDLVDRESRASESNVRDEDEEEKSAQSPLWTRREQSEKEVLEDSFTNGVSEDDEENSRMLVINEDDNSQDLTASSDRKGNETESDVQTSPAPTFTFFRVLPLTSDNVCIHSGEKKRPVSPPSPPSPKKDDEEETRDDCNDDEDDSSSVSSSSSSSSSSTSSSSTSSDDDDRINFKKRVEQAAQAAREAAASAAANTATSLHENPPPPLPVSSTPHSDTPTYSNQDSTTLYALPHSKSMLGGECGGGETVTPVDSFAPSSTPPHFPPTAAFPAYRHPDDIQAAQGLAALGKGHHGVKQVDSGVISGVTETPPHIAKLLLKSSISSKITQKLLQNKNVDVRRVGPTSFQCGVCGKLFCRLTKVLEHHVSHTGEKPWECDSCDKKFASHYSMQKHKRVKHTPAHLQGFTCYICERAFSVPSALQLHLVTHEALKPFPCSVCGQTFALKFTKDAHEAQHTGHRPWCCNVCGKTFVTKYKLKAHMKAHTGELFCAICNRTFGSQDVLTRHKRRHEAAASKTAPSSEGANAKQTSGAQKMNKPSGSKGRGRSAPKGAKSLAPSSTSTPSGFRCQMCSKMFVKSTDLTHHLASCNAITYCPPPTNTIQPVIPGTSLLPEPDEPQPLNIHQALPSTPTLTTCMMVEEKKLTQFTSQNDVTENIDSLDQNIDSLDQNIDTLDQNIDSLDRRSYLLTSQLTSLTSFQHQEPIIQATTNPVPQVLPDYLSEVAFGNTSGNAATIIFQATHEQG